jgi:hypothetical protein
MWLSIVARTLLTRGSFICVDDVQVRILAVFDDGNQAMVKPFTWISQSKPYTIERLNGFPLSRMREPVCS